MNSSVAKEQWNKKNLCLVEYFTSLLTLTTLTELLKVLKKKIIQDFGATFEQRS